jgi:predicted nucleic acid-binding Zn ribbon protein
MVGIYMTLFRDLMKFDREYLSVLKDQHTVFFAAFILLSLLFKLFILDTYYKDEMNTPRVCSMFISEYMPEFFLALSCLLVTAKAIMLTMMHFSDKSAESYNKNKKRRERHTNRILILLFIALFLIMNFRFVNTCYRSIQGNFFRDYLNFKVTLTL